MVQGATLKKERNIVLTRDPFVEFNPYTYILVYNYPEQVN
jgi:hypothetical protein